MSIYPSDLKSEFATALLTAEDIGQVIIEIGDLNGTIKLKGVVETEEDKLSVEALAKGQEGVISVINELRVSGLWQRDFLSW
jgi:osmotically-inducible protein OsmY